MPAKLANPTSAWFISTAVLLAATALPGSASAVPGAVVQNPNHEPAAAPVVIDFSPDAAPADRPRFDRNPANAVRFSDLDAYRSTEPDGPIPAPGVHQLPNGLSQIGGMVVPDAMVEGADMVPDLTHADDPQGGGPSLDDICAFPEEVPAGIYDYDHRPGGEIPRFHTVYLNYTGEPDGLFTGGENSAENMSNIARSGHPYPVYGGGEERAIAAAQAVAADFQDWAVNVVYLERPPKVLPYTMVMIGGHHSDTTAGPSGGVAPLDCEDFGQRNVCYAFQNNSPATQQANVISQEIGHTLGLGHTSASDSVMAAGYANTQGGDLGFNETCAPTIQVQGQSASCTGVNRCHCGVPDAQHDWQTLSTTFSPAGVDVVEPTIAIVEPADGAVFQDGDTIRVEFDPWDDVGGYGWKMMIEDSAGELIVDQVDYERALEFDLVGVPPGVYTLTGLIRDHADHVTTTSITITVEGEAADGTAGSGEGDTAAEDTADEDTAAEEGTAASDDAGQDGTGVDEGCGCVTERTPISGHALWLLALVGFVRRRR